MPTLRDIGEFEAIRRLRRALPDRPGSAVGPRDAGIAIDSGDDAAVLTPRPERDLVATTDAFVEGRHYDPRWLSPRETGSRLAVANLSDLAAMASEPRWALLEIGARADREIDELVEMQAGLAQALAAHGAWVVGGNLTAVPDAEWLSLTLLGDTPRGRAWRRSGASAGDLLAVTGAPGRAGAGWALAQRLGERARDPEWRPLLDAWLRPRSRVDLALAAHDAVTAAIDVSDGFAGDLAHLCEASGVGAEVFDAAWPPDPALALAAEALSVDTEALRFGPSDDYELLLAVKPAARAACEDAARAQGVAIAFVGGFIEPGAGIVAVSRSGERRPLVGRGFDHFAGR